MADYKTYLAQQLLTEEKLITYRLLSRELKVNVNTAKEMLWDFHKWRNDQRPGTVHATYLVYGTRKQVCEQDGDVEMTDSPAENGHPFSDDVPAHTLTLVKEEILQDVLGQYEEVSSIHVYSLAPHPLKDTDLLIEVGRQVLKKTADGYSEETNKACMPITNPAMWRRQRPGATSRKPAAATPAPAKVETKSQVKEEAKAVKDEPKASAAKSSTANDSKAAVNTAAKKTAASSTPSMKRQGSSGGIGQMFAKAASKPKKPVAEKKEAPSPALSDEGEDDDSEAVPEAKQTTETGRARKDRQAELRRMMEESDEEEPEEAKTAVEEDPMEEDAPPPEPEPEPETQPMSQKDEEPSQTVSSTGDGRKRGRRRVMKKKQITDDQGYLVTIQEQGWESFSEEDTPPASSKAKPQTEKPASSAKPKKAAPKGQGNIMSFFSKK